MNWSLINQKQSNVEYESMINGATLVMEWGQFLWHSFKFLMYLPHSLSYSLDIVSLAFCWELDSCHQLFLVPLDLLLLDLNLFSSFNKSLKRFSS